MAAICAFLESGCYYFRLNSTVFGRTIIGMRKLCSLFGACVLLVGAAGKDPFAGRWDLTVKTPAAAYPAWIEVVDNGGNPEARIQPRGGSVRPAHETKLDGGRLIVTISPAAEDRPAITWELTVKNNV